MPSPLHRTCRSEHKHGQACGAHEGYWVPARHNGWQRIAHCAGLCFLRDHESGNDWRPHDSGPLSEPVATASGFHPSQFWETLWVDRSHSRVPTPVSTSLPDHPETIRRVFAWMRRKRRPDRATRGCGVQLLLQCTGVRGA